MSSIDLDAVVDRIVFSKEETGFAVLRVTIPGEALPVTAVGPLAGVQLGESVRLHGRWVEDRTYGRQLKVEGYLPVLPVSKEGIERFLASGLVGGVAKGLAHKLVAKFGDRTLEVLDREPHRLREVGGIGKKRSEKLLAAWSEQRDVREVMVFLQSHGVATHHAMKIWKRYGKAAIAVLRADPYRLSQEIAGIGFKSADQIALALGLPKDSPRRAEAGLLHVLREAADDGHTFLPRALLIERAAGALGIGPEACETALETLASDRKVIIDPRPADPPIEAVYSTPLYLAETAAARTIVQLLATPITHAPRNRRVILGRALPELEAKLGITLAEEQRAAVRAALSSKVLVITGGPGTGKTTLLRAVLALYGHEGREIALAAPTGRAARRLQEATGKPASTIHRLLEVNPGTMTFQRNAENPLEIDVLVVDEASMLDILLFRQLLEALPDRAQLLLVGDIDQLPSVGPGRVLSDLISSERVEVVRLQHIFRQAEASAIVVNAHQINHGELPVTDNDPAGDFFFIERDDPRDVVETVKLLVSERIPKRFGLDPVRDIQVLTPMHKGPLGAQQLNLELQALLNPGEAGGTSQLKPGDKVMQTRNDYDRDVSNGDIGRVVAVNEVDKTVTVAFDERNAKYAFSELDPLVLAYACTIHKSQGSEFPAVVVPVHSQHFVMLRRNLLYTAITRGKRVVVLVGERRALRVAVSSFRIEARWSGLADRLRAPGRPPESPG